MPLPHYGDHRFRPIVANYDPDHDDKADLAVHTPDGFWAIDFAADGYGTWNTFPFYAAGSGYGSGDAQLVPGHYTSTSGNLDQAIKTRFGFWQIDRASTGYGSVDLTFSTGLLLLDKRYSYIDGMFVSRPGGPASSTFSETPVSPSQLKIGVRYTANVHVTPGPECIVGVDDDGDGFTNDGCPPVGSGESQCHDSIDNDSDGFVNDACPVVGAGESTPDAASVRVNPDLRVPSALNVEDVGGHTLQNSSGAIVIPTIDASASAAVSGARSRSASWCPASTPPRR